jgi:hypothetical protein
MNSGGALFTPLSFGPFNAILYLNIFFFSISLSFRRACETQVAKVLEWQV